MNIYAVIPLISALAYLVLIGIVLSRPLNKANRVFLIYLGASVTWSLISMTMHAEYFSPQTIFIHRSMLVVGLLTVVSYYHFVRVYSNKSVGLGVVLGYAALIPLAVMLNYGYFLKESYVLGGRLFFEFDSWFYLYGVIGAAFLGVAIFSLVQRLRHSTDPNERNRAAYLVSAISIWLVFQVPNVIPALSSYSIDHIGCAINAAIISYAMLRYQLLNIRFAFRWGLTVFIVLSTCAAVYFGAILLALRLDPDLPLWTVILVASSLALVLGLFSRPLRYRVQKWVDRVFYRETYEYRQTLLNFNARMGNILNLEQLADELLPTVVKAIHISKASLLFPETASGDYTEQYTFPKADGVAEERLRLDADNPVVTWLDRESQPLDLNSIDHIPEFKGLWAVEREQLRGSAFGLLCPIRSNSGLIGILALGEREADVIFSHEDLELVTGMAAQAGIVMENAQLYSQAVMRANTDGLTGLYNHRHFHERLEQEIGRGSRFGNTFSLIMLDLDLFKAYNDNYGHLAGDKVLQRTARTILNSIRGVDMAFRYGGEEFTMILPETRLDDAHRVAERMRKAIETQGGPRMMPITASFGVANWPLDGVMREEVLGRADEALYRAKQTGRNRTCLSSDVGKPETPLIGTELEARPRALSIIYALAATIDTKDHYTYGHSRKVSNYAVALAEALGLPQDRIATIRAAGLLHDIGKVGVPDVLLNKKGPLNEKEWEDIRAHPQFGVEILRHVIDLVNCLPAILHHHERFDGSGYPTGLKGNNIPLEACILAIADAYDAITSPRPYREQLSTQQAFEELKNCAGSQFHPELVDVFCRMLSSGTPKKRDLELQNEGLETREEVP